MRTAGLMSNSGIEISTGYGMEPSPYKLAGGLSNHLLYGPTISYTAAFCALCELWTNNLTSFVSVNSVICHFDFQNLYQYYTTAQC